MDARNLRKVHALQAAIDVLTDVVDPLIREGKTDEARRELEHLNQYVSPVIGGNARVCELLDTWGREFNARYVILYAKS